MESIIHDMALAPQGRQKIEWVKRHMAVLSGMPVSRFKSCVVAGNLAELSRIKGLGKKQ